MNLDYCPNFCSVKEIGLSYGEEGIDFKSQRQYTLHLQGDSQFSKLSFSLSCKLSICKVQQFSRLRFLVILCQLDPDGKIKGFFHHSTTVISVHQRFLPHAVFSQLTLKFLLGKCFRNSDRSSAVAGPSSCQS